MHGKCCVGAVFCYLSSVCVTHCVREIPAGWYEALSVLTRCQCRVQNQERILARSGPYCFWAAWNCFSEHWYDLHFLFQSRVDPIIKSCRFSWKQKVFVTNRGFLKKLTLSLKTTFEFLKKTQIPNIGFWKKLDFWENRDPCRQDNPPRILPSEVQCTKCTG